MTTTIIITIIHNSNNSKTNNNNDNNNYNKITIIYNKNSNNNSNDNNNSNNIKIIIIIILQLAYVYLVIFWREDTDISLDLRGIAVCKVICFNTRLKKTQTTWCVIVQKSLITELIWGTHWNTDSIWLCLSQISNECLTGNK